MEYRQYLLERRLKLDISINMLCKMTESSRQHYYRVERGISTTKLTFVYMCKIAKALDFTLEEMFHHETMYLESLKLKDESN